MVEGLLPLVNPPPDSRREPPLHKGAFNMIEIAAVALLLRNDIGYYCNDIVCCVILSEHSERENLILSKPPLCKNDFPIFSKIFLATK